MHPRGREVAPSPFSRLSPTGKAAEAMMPARFPTPEVGWFLQMGTLAVTFSRAQTEDKYSQACPECGAQSKAEAVECRGGATPASGAH